MKHKLLFVIVVFIHSVSFSQTAPKKWTKELNSFSKLVKTKHVTPFRELSEDKFDAEVSRLKQNLTSLNDYQIMLEIARIMTLIGDGHTSFSVPNDQELVSLTYYPIKFYYFDDGIFVIGTSKEYSDLVGSKLLAIDGVSTANIITTITPYIQRENEQEIPYAIPFQLNVAELLFYMKITKTLNEATFSFEKEGQKREKKIISIDGDKWFGQYIIPANKALGEESSGRLVYMFSNGYARPHVKNREDYWYDTIPKKNAIYFQYNSCWDQEGRPTVRATIEGISLLMKSNPKYRLIVDLRQNAGGEPAYLQPLIDWISSDASFEKNKAIVLVGVRTFSAALTNACQLKQTDRCILMGQYPRGKPNSPSEGRYFKLKSVKMQISLSTQQLNRYPELGSSPVLPLDFYVPLNFSDWKNDIDKTFGDALNN